jgi:four helix bundle protein
MENSFHKTRFVHLEERLITFASKMIDVAEGLPKTPAGKHLSGQILRSGTSPALNYGEARGAESSSDFVHKIKICIKELRETFICLQIIEKRNWFQEGKLKEILIENNELISIFVASAKTASSKVNR